MKVTLSRQTALEPGHVQMLEDLSLTAMTLISKHLSRRSLCRRIRIYQICFFVCK